MQVVLVLQGLPEGKIRKSILDAFKQVRINVTYIIMGLKGPGSAVIAVDMDKKDKEKISDTIEIQSNTVTVTVLPSQLNQTFMYGINDETKKMFASVASLNQFVKVEMDQILGAETENFVNGQNRVEYIKCDLERTFKTTLWRKYKIYSFGSRDTGLGLPTSDCDFFIDITGDMYNGTKAQSQTEQRYMIIMELFSILKRQQHSKTQFSNLTCLTNIKVPILRFLHETTGLSCDVSCKNGLSVENTHLVKKYLDMDPRVKWVVTAVKIWAKQNDLIGFKKFTSYALMWMTLYVLMEAGVIIPVVDLKKMYEGPKKTVAGWECGYCQGVIPNIPESTNKMTPQELLHKFFYFYGHTIRTFWTKKVLCPLIGGGIEKECFERLSLPPDFQNYLQSLKCNSDEKVEYFKLNCVLSVQDPLEMSHNITKFVERLSFKRFQKLCMNSARAFPTIGE